MNIYVILLCMHTYLDEGIVSGDGFLHDVVDTIESALLTGLAGNLNNTAGLVLDG
jgi:hypothetical protein